jgi:PAS domain S-box-containing protein
LTKEQKAGTAEIAASTRSMVYRPQPNTVSLRAKWTIASGAAILLLLFIGVLSYRRLEQEAAAQQWLSHTHEVIEKLDATLVNSLELDASRPNTESSSQHDSQTIAKLQADLSDIRSLTADNLRQQSAVGQLTTLVETRNALQQSGQLPMKLEAVAQSRDLLDQIRSVLLGMRREEERLERERLQALQSESRKARIILGIGYTLALVALALTGISVLREMQRRTRSEEQLRVAQKQFRLLFDSNPIPTWVYDIETLAIVDVNTTAINRYGYAREEFLRFKITDIRPKEDVASLMDSLHKGSESAEETGPWRHRKKSGEIIDVQIRSYPLRFDGRTARLVVATDITEKKRAEEALKQNEERFRMIISNIKDYAVITLDTEGLVSSWNGTAERITGYSAAEVLGKHVSIFYTPEEAAIGKPTIEMETAIKEGRFEDDGLRVRKDGSQFWVNVVVTPLQDEFGRVRGFVKITRDTTEKRKAEQELIRRSAELEAANKELESFSYSVSHDLRAPLRGIDGFSQALEEDYGSNLDATGKNYLSRIRAGTRRMGVLIDDLLNLARVTRAEMYREKIDLTKMAGDIVRELQAAEPERKVHLEVDKGLVAEGDNRLVRVALQNLLGNAWKFTSKRSDAKIEFRAHKSNGSQAYYVRDNGAGFDPTYAARLFGAFQRLHSMEEFPGTGIGLATVQRIVHRHGGKVWAEGALNRGATVYFTLESEHAVGGTEWMKA